MSLTDKTFTVDLGANPADLAKVAERLADYARVLERVRENEHLADQDRPLTYAEVKWISADKASLEHCLVRLLTVTGTVSPTAVEAQQ